MIQFVKIYSTYACPEKTKRIKKKIFSFIVGEQETYLANAIIKRIHGEGEISSLVIQA